MCHIYFSDNEDAKGAGAAGILQMETKLAELKNSIAAMQADLKDDLSNAHAGLLAQMKDCCKNNSALALLIKQGIQDELIVSISLPDNLFILVLLHNFDTFHFK